MHKLVRIDRNREYIAGHSMGGWASWLLPILYPDRFAAAFPASGPATQGLWAGCEQDACFQSANDGRPRDEWLTPLLENLRWVPYVNYQGAADELVPVTGVTAHMEKIALARAAVSLLRLPARGALRAAGVRPVGRRRAL